MTVKDKGFAEDGIGGVFQTAVVAVYFSLAVRQS
jgi:hypothetical protein